MLGNFVAWLGDLWLKWAIRCFWLNGCAIGFVFAAFSFTCNKCQEWIELVEERTSLYLGAHSITS